MDFACALADGAKLYVAVELFNRVIFDEAITAVDLKRLIGSFDRHFGSEKLGHGRFFGDAFALIFKRAGAVDEPAGGFDIGGHGGQFVLNGLELGNRTAELFARFGILQRRIESALGDAKRQGRDGDAAAVENAEAVDKTFTLLAEKVSLRQFAIGEKNLAGGAGAHAQVCSLSCRRGNLAYLFQVRRR